MSRPMNAEVASVIGLLKDAKLKVTNAQGKIDTRVAGFTRVTIRNLPPKIKAQEIKAVEHKIKSTFGKKLVGFGLEASVDDNLNSAMQLWVKYKQ